MSAAGKGESLLQERERELFTELRNAVFVRMHVIISLLRVIISLACCTGGG